MKEGILRVNDGLELMVDGEIPVKIPEGGWLDVVILGSWVSGITKIRGHDWTICLGDISRVELPIGSGMKARIK